MDLQEALRLVGEPSTDAQTLYTIASQFPQTHALIALHPNAYDGLLQWLATSHDPAVAEALARRNEIMAASQAGANELENTVQAPEDATPAEAPTGEATHEPEPATDDTVVAEPDVSPVAPPAEEGAASPKESVVTPTEGGISAFVAEAATTQMQEQGTAETTALPEVQGQNGSPTQYLQPEQFTPASTIRPQWQRSTPKYLL